MAGFNERLVEGKERIAPAGKGAAESGRDLETPTGLRLPSGTR